MTQPVWPLSNSQLVNNATRRKLDECHRTAAAKYATALACQYKAYLEDLGNVGTGYTTSNGFHLSVVTALLGVLALTKAGDVFEGSKAYLGMSVSGFAVLVCLIWSRSVASYRKLFGIKFTILREMEERGRLFPIYRREDELRGKTSLLESDRLIPLLLALPFLVTLICLTWRIFK